MNIIDLSGVLNSADNKKTAIFYNDQQLTYDQLTLKINKTCNNLKNSIKKGYRVIIKLQNTPESIIMTYALIKLSAIPVPIPYSLKSREINEIINDVKANAIIMEDGLQILNTDNKLPQCEDAAMIFYTSGTTGKQKGIIHSKETILTTCRTEGEILGITGDDVIGGTVPLSFTYGFGALAVIPFLFNATTSLLEFNTSRRNAAETFKTIESDQVTIFYSTPTTYRLMLKTQKNYDLSSLRLLISAGETMGIGLYRRMKMFFPNTEIIEHLGCTESFHALISNRPGDVKPGSLGLALPCYQVKICNEGMECPQRIFGKLAFNGPVGRPIGEYSLKNWNYTGDIAYRDSEGYIWYVSRSDDLIKTAGYLVSPYEIEDIFMEHPAVSEVLIVGVADAMIGRRIKAHVVLEDTFTASEAMKNELIDFIKNQIAEYKVPQDIEFIASLLQNYRGKKLRKIDCRKST